MEFMINFNLIRNYKKLGGNNAQRCRASNEKL